MIESVSFIYTVLLANSKYINSLSNEMPFQNGY